MRDQNVVLVRDHNISFCSEIRKSSSDTPLIWSLGFYELSDSQKIQNLNGSVFLHVRVESEWKTCKK